MEIRHERSITPVFVAFLSPCGEQRLHSPNSPIWLGARFAHAPPEEARRPVPKMIVVARFSEASGLGCAAGSLSPVAVHLRAARVGDGGKEL